MVALFFIGVLVVLYMTGAAPGAAVWANIVLAAIGAPLFVCRSRWRAFGHGRISR
jgi:hypothetical protein